ncbi:MAG: hypothetical protein WC580_02560 [Agrococcus sp.]
MQPNEPNDREGREPAEAAPPAHEAPASEADAIGYDDPSVSPVEALRSADASDDRTGRE